MLENLVDGVEPADATSLGTMLQHVERLGNLVEQLLELSKLESGAVPGRLTNHEPWGSANRSRSRARALLR